MASDSEKIIFEFFQSQKKDRLERIRHLNRMLRKDRSFLPVLRLWNSFR